MPQVDPLDHYHGYTTHTVRVKDSTQEYEACADTASWLN